MTRYPPSTDHHAGHRRLSSPFLTVAVVLFLFFVCGATQPVTARLERQTYVSYRTPHLCSLQMIESVQCGGEKPMCCVASSAIRCCAATSSCGNCTDIIVGYEMPRSSVILGCFSLSVLVLLGSIIMSGVGRHLAWVLERRRVIENYRKRLLLRRAEAREFKKELAETEEKDIEDSVACVICCARHIDVALTPCGHVCCCKFCAKRLKECPVCRAAVQRCFDLPLYYVKQLVKASAEGSEEGDGDEGKDEARSKSPAAAVATATAYDAASPDADTDPAARRGSLSAEAEGEEMDDALRKEGRETRNGFSGSRHTGCYEHLQNDQDDIAEEMYAAAAATPATTSPSTAHFNPFRGSKRYTRLMNAEEESDNEDEDRLDRGAAAAITVERSAAVRTPTTPLPASASSLRARESRSSSPASAPRRNGYISVDK